MISFKSYLREEYIELAEKLITFAGQAYPKFGHVIIMAGGAGSGKGFVKDNLIGAEGITFDVDVLKTMAAKTPAIAKKVKDELGVDLKDLASNLKDPENVSRLHEIIGDYLQLDDKRLKTVYKSIIQAHPDRKPNLIFDVTLKDLRKLQNVTRQVKALGYKNESIHLVWVVNDIEVAKAQNLKRDRVVPAEILVNTHRGASQTMNDIVNMGKTLKNYMDGDIVFAFNKVGVDSALVKSGKPGKKIGMKGKTKTGQFIKDANYFYVKRAGKSIPSVNAVSLSLRKKIASYVPRGVDWA